MTTIRRLLIVAGLLAGVWSSGAYAQTELERARSSLGGIDRFGVAVDIESSQALSTTGALDVVALQNRLTARLRETGLDPLATYDGLESPYLYLHINAMESGPGLVPFSIELDFFQPVYLDRDRTVSTAAATWEDSLVGLVSQDRLDLIPEAALELVEQFIEDFKRINS